jgi:hypothetical protein
MYADFKAVGQGLYELRGAARNGCLNLVYLVFKFFELSFFLCRSWSSFSLSFTLFSRILSR